MVNPAETKLSPWWRHTVILVMIFGFSILTYVAVRAYRDAPPIPEKVVDGRGNILFTKDDIQSGQQVFLKYGLMEHGTLWGHGAYLGPDYTAEYLHDLAVTAQTEAAAARYGKDVSQVNDEERQGVSADVSRDLHANRYDPATGTLTFSRAEAKAYEGQLRRWSEYFAEKNTAPGLPPRYISDSTELKQLTSFFAWATWATVADRPGKTFSSYTNNWPYEEIAGNKPTADAVLWSALSLIGLLGMTGLILFLFGKFNYLGWRSGIDETINGIPRRDISGSQIALVKYFVVVALLFVLQTLFGGVVAHYRAEPFGFYGIDLAKILPYNLARTWHLQLAIFWVATAYVTGGLFLAPAIGGGDPKRQKLGVNVLFSALLIVVLGSLFGEYLGINQLLGNLWFWLGHQGWEYLDLGRLWQILLAAGLILWLTLVYRGIRPALKDKRHGDLSSLFLYSAIAIPLFYLPAMFFGPKTNFTVVDNWRFWIIHLWVEGFFELFATVMVASMFYRMGLVSSQSASRVIYLDAILYLGSGIVGTGHHWYWTGQSDITMALGAMFSALEVVPLTLLTLDAWDFIRLSRKISLGSAGSPAGGQKWAIYFLVATGFWNFLGAGVFGFLINLPIVSYFEVGTTLTPNHGHAAMMGVFGMLALAIMMYGLRDIVSEGLWARNEKYAKLGFWGVNAGLMLMVITNLFPGGVLQLADVLNNGYWHARRLEFINSGAMRLLEWFRLVGDTTFIVLGSIPLLILAVKLYVGRRRESLSAGAGPAPISTSASEATGETGS